MEKVLTGNLKCLKSFMRALEHDDGGTPHLAEQLNQGTTGYLLALFFYPLISWSAI